IAWDAAGQLGSGLKTIQIQLTPNDGFADGATVVSTTFTAGIAPAVGQLLAAVATPVRNSASIATGLVTVPYTLGDSIAESVNVTVEMSINGGAFSGALAGAGGDGISGLAANTAGVVHSFVWDAGTQLGSTARSNIRVRVTPSNAARAGAASTSGVFAIGNAL